MQGHVVCCIGRWHDGAATDFQEAAPADNNSMVMGKGWDRMKKNFTKRLSVYMLAAFLVTVTAVFVLQTVVSQSNNTATGMAKLEDVKEKLAGNEENIRKLTENLSEDNLAKTRAFADMIAASPSILNDTAELNRIKERLKENEHHVID